MPLTDDFGGTFGSGLTLTVVTPGGGTVTIPIQGIENITPPTRTRKLDKYTPLTGVRAGKEQGVICSVEVSELAATLTYEKAHQIALDGICGINNCAITFVMPDGLTCVGTGGVYQMSMARIEDSKHVTADFKLLLNADWTLTDAGTGVVVQTYTLAMVDGVASLDLTECGQGGTVDLTGKFIKRLRLEAPATNGAVVTVKKGGTTGYSPSVADFEVDLASGTTSDSTWLTGTAVGPTAYLMDITGTTTDALNIYIEAAPGS